MSISCSRSEKPPAYTALLRKETGRDLDPKGRGGHSFFSPTGKGNICEFLDTYLCHYEATREHGYITVPTGNHDVPRLGWGRSRAEVEAVFAFVLHNAGHPLQSTTEMRSA